MIRISTLTLVTVLLLSFAANSQRVYSDNGSASSYTLYAGDSLVIKKGTFTGSISNWQQGAKITVEASATFNPSSFGYFLGTLRVYGNANLPSLDGQTARFGLSNYGKVVIAGTTYLGGGAKLENNYGSTIKFTGSVNVNNSSIINTGIITAMADFYMGNGSKLTNNNTINVNGNLELNNIVTTNSGKLYAAKKLTLSKGTYTNNCKTIADATIVIDETTVNNNGLLWASSAANNSSISNTGKIVSTIDGRVKSVNFVNDGDITGRGYFYFTGSTKHNGGKIGKTGTTTDSLFFYDATRTSSSRIFDQQSGTVYNNVKYRAFTAPDTVSSYPSCGLSYSSSAIILPVKWNFFYVNVSATTPSLNWGADQDPGTVFQVQRSYDGIDFTTIETVDAKLNSATYQFADRQVNTQAAVVYYRIKATEPTGAQKISETKLVRFSNKAGMTLQVSPNPFTSQFTINFQSTNRDLVSIRVINLTGQVMANRTSTVAAGFNSISITEAASLSRGIYMVQVMSENKIIATERIVKQ